MTITIPISQLLIFEGDLRAWSAKKVKAAIVEVTSRATLTSGYGGSAYNGSPSGTQKAGEDWSTAYDAAHPMPKLIQRF